MQILIVGGGALGTIVAGHLSRSGMDVTLFVKPAQAVAFAGPEVELTGIVTFKAPVQVVSDPAKLGRFDYLLVCVKGRDTRAALEPLRAVDAGAVLSLQNGVVKNDVLAELFGAERVLGALAVVSGQLLKPGVVMNTATTGIWLGETDGRQSKRGERLAELLTRAGIASTCVPDIGRREWDKLRLYLSLGLVSAITRIDTVTMVANPDLSGVCVRVGAEAARVAAAEGYPLTVPDRGYQETLEAFARPVREKGTVHYMSITQDVMAGRPTELEATAGDVLARALRLGVDVPVIETCTNLLRGIERRD